PSFPTRRSSDLAHIRIPFTLPFVSGRWRFESAPGPSASSLKHPPPAGGSFGLAAQAELLDEGTVALDVLPLQVVEEAPAPAHEPQQTPPRVVVLRVLPEVLGKIVDPSREKCDLHLRGAC